MARTKRHMKRRALGGKSRRRSSGRSRRMRRGGQEMMQPTTESASTSSSILGSAKGLFNTLSSDVSSMWGKAKESSIGKSIGSGYDSAKQSATGAWGNMTGSTTNSAGGYRAHKRSRRGGQVVGFNGDWREYGPAVGGRRHRRKRR